MVSVACQPQWGQVSVERVWISIELIQWVSWPDVDQDAICSCYRLKPYPEAPEMAEQAIPIGELSRRTGCNIETIRYYERIGLTPAGAPWPLSQL
jgi:hypothetical protein